MEEGSNASSSINPLLFDGLCTRNNTNSNASSIINPLLFDGLCTRNNTVKSRASIDSHCHSHTNDRLIAACYKYPIDGHGIDHEDNNALEKKGSFFPGGLHDQYCSPSSRITTRDNATEIVYYDKNVSLGSEKRPYNQGGGSLVTSSSFRTGQCHPWPSIIDVSDDAKAFGDESVIRTRSHDHELHENPAPCYDGMSSLYSHLPSSSNPMVMNHQHEKPCNSLLYTSNNNCKENLDSIDVTLSSPISFKHGSLPHSTHDNIPYNEDPLISSNPNVVAIQGGEGGGHMNAITNKDTSSYSHPMDREIGNDGYTFAPVCSGGTHETSAEMSVKELSNSASKGKTHMDEAYCTQSKLDADGDSGEVSQPRKRSSSKRSRVAENHNLSEKRRRNRINEKLRSMQALIPNSTKTDKASILDEAIEYLKSLQSQLQIMSSRNSLRMSPMMNVPSVIQHHLHTMNQVTPRSNHMDGHIGNLPINMSSNLITPSFEHALRPSNVLDSQINSTQTHIDDAINMASSSNDFWSTHHDIPSKKARL